MRIGVTYEKGEIFQHFGHTKQFKLYDVKNGKIEKTEVVLTNGQGHGALSSFLKQLNVEVLICGGMGAGAKNALSDAGIQIYGGVSGSSDEAVSNYIAGKLSFDTDAHCTHHEHEHHCGENKQGCSGNCQ